MKLCGKVSNDDKRQLDITAQVELDISVDGQVAKVPSWYNQEVNQHV